MADPLSSGPSSTRVAAWLEHDNRRTRLTHVGHQSLVAADDLAPMSAATLVTSVEGRELRHEIALPEGAPAGTRCRTVARASAVA